MIVDILIYIARIFLGFLDYMPNWVIPDQVMDYFTTFISYGIRFNEVFPVLLMWKMILLIVGFEIALKGLNLILKILKRAEFSPPDYQTTPNQVLKENNYIQVKSYPVTKIPVKRW